jgi:predicted transcriptional regulator
MSKNRSMSVRLSPDLNKHVADIARALDRPHSWVIEQAIKDFCGSSGMASRRD